jgi:hypothetical protein
MKVAPVNTLAEVEALGRLALNTPTMRKMLGENHADVCARVEYKELRSQRAYGRCLPWWAYTVRAARVEMCSSRREAFLQKEAAYRAGVVQINTRLGTGITRACTTVHEVSHLIPLTFTGKRIPWHGREFYRTLSKILDDLYSPEKREFYQLYCSATWPMYAYDRAAKDLLAILRGQEAWTAPAPVKVVSDNINTKHIIGSIIFADAMGKEVTLAPARKFALDSAHGFTRLVELSPTETRHRAWGRGKREWLPWVQTPVQSAQRRGNALACRLRMARQSDTF